MSFFAHNSNNLEGDQLRTVAQVPDYTSHVIRTRNLDMAAAGDFYGDGQVVLNTLLALESRLALNAISSFWQNLQSCWIDRRPARCGR